MRIYWPRRRRTTPPARGKSRDLGSTGAQLMASPLREAVRAGRPWHGALLPGPSENPPRQRQLGRELRSRGARQPRRATAAGSECAATPGPGTQTASETGGRPRPRRPALDAPRRARRPPTSLMACRSADGRPKLLRQYEGGCGAWVVPRPEDDQLACFSSNGSQLSRRQTHSRCIRLPTD